MRDSGQLLIYITSSRLTLMIKSLYKNSTNAMLFNSISQTRSDVQDNCWYETGMSTISCALQFIS